MNSSRNTALILRKLKSSVQQSIWKNSSRRVTGVGADAPLIGNVGMIRPDKGQLILVEAAPLVLAERTDARFVIVGQGTGILKRGINVRNAIDRAGLADQVIMAGYRWDTPDVYAACDMIVIA